MRSTGLLRWCALVLFCAAADPSLALSLTDAIALARQNDPTYLSAQFNVVAKQQQSSQAASALRPQITATANRMSNRRVYEVLPDTGLPPTIDHYKSSGEQVNLTQPLWNHANYYGWRESQAAVRQAQYQLTAADDDLLVRLSQAWFDVMLARDTMAAAERQVKAMRQQWEQFKQGSELGLTSGPQLEEMRAKFDQAVAERAEAEADQNLKLSALEQITGPLPEFAPPYLSNDFSPTFDSGKSGLEEWLKETEAQNASIAAAQFALEAARREVSKQRAGHEPTIDLVGTYSRNRQDVGQYLGQSGYDIDQRSAGIQLTLPIFSGGAQLAKTREAVAAREKTQQDLEAARRNATSLTKQAWYAWQAGKAREVAALQGIRLARIALEAAQRGRASGMKTQLDILEAEQQRYAAERDLQKARYDIITSIVKLKATTGELGDQDVSSLDASLKDHKDDVMPSPESQLHQQRPEQTWR